MKVTYILSKHFVAQKPAFIGKCFAGGWGVAKVSSLIAKKPNILYVINFYFNTRISPMGFGYKDNIIKIKNTNIKNFRGKNIYSFFVV